MPECTGIGTLRSYKQTGKNDRYEIGRFGESPSSHPRTK